MSILKGNSTVKRIYKGSERVVAMYRGADLVYPDFFRFAQGYDSAYISSGLGSFLQYGLKGSSGITDYTTTPTAPFVIHETATRFEYLETISDCFLQLSWKATVRTSALGAYGSVSLRRLDVNNGIITGSVTLETSPTFIYDQTDRDFEWLSQNQYSFAPGEFLAIGHDLTTLTVTDETLGFVWVH